MARILVHSLASTAGGGVTYLKNLLARLADQGNAHQWIVLVPNGASIQHDAGANVSLREGPPHPGPIRRVLHDQWTLRRLLRDERIDAILATGNFGLLRPPVPQILLCRNALYFSVEHMRELRRRSARRELVNILLRRRMALASIRSSVLNIVPSEAFGREIREWLPGFPSERIKTIPHGFDHDRFINRSVPLSPEREAALSRRPGVRRILMVSHYNYFRNFETVIRSLPKLISTIDEPIELVLTTKLGDGVQDHRYDTTHAWRLAQRLGVAHLITMLGPVPNEELHSLYRRADVVVCPSYAESFGHPMVEAMASGRPVVASDRATHREVCGSAALHFSTFDERDLADKLRLLLADPGLAHQLASAGIRRAHEFSWNHHFETLVATIERWIATDPARNASWKPFELQTAR